MTQTVPEPQTSTPRIPNDSTFGARLALVRQLMRWGNIAEAARECGVPTDSWRNWEVDGREPRRLVTIAMAIATRANVDVDWLVYGPDGKNRPVRAAADLTSQYLPQDPLAARLIPRTGRPITRGDGRRRSHSAPIRALAVSA